MSNRLSHVFTNLQPERRSAILRCGSWGSFFKLSNCIWGSACGNVFVSVSFDRISVLLLFRLNSYFVKTTQKSIQCVLFVWTLSCFHLFLWCPRGQGIFALGLDVELMSHFSLVTSIMLSLNVPQHIWRSHNPCCGCLHVYILPRSCRVTPVLKETVEDVTNA